MYVTETDREVLILRYLNSENLIFDIRRFAGDTSLFHFVISADVSADVLNHDYNAIENWACKWKMSFNLNPTNKPSKLFFSTKSIKVVKTPCIMYVQYFGGVQYLGEYHDICVWRSVPEGYHEYCGVILSNVGGYHDASGVIMSTVGGNLLLFEYPDGAAHPSKVLMISPTCIMISPTVFKLQRMVSPTVLLISS